MNRELIEPVYPLILTHKEAEWLLTYLAVQNHWGISSDDPLATIMDKLTKKD